MTTAQETEITKKQEWLKALEEIIDIYGTTREWTNINEILRVLGTITKYQQICHVMYPSGCGFHIESARRAYESNNIFIKALYGSTYQIRPIRLYFQHFEDTPEWSYFMLETASQKSINENNKEEKEAVHANEDGSFITEANAYYDDEQPNVYRYCKEGRFLLVSIYSPYNSIHETYSGLHNSCDRDEFKSIVVNLIQKSNND